MALILDLRAAIREFVHDGEIVALEGFTHLIPSAAGHEVIRQRRRFLSFSRRGNNVLSTNTRVRDENTD
jgi:glutaconate CoA-transferase, subunit A